MEEKATSLQTAPASRFMRRWSCFFVYLLFFPLLLELIFGAGSFSFEEWANWAGGLLFRAVPGALFIWAAFKLPKRAAPFLMAAVSTAAGVFNLLDIFLLVNFGTVFDYGILQLMCIAPGTEIRGFFQLFWQSSATWVILLLYPAAGVVIFKVRKYKLLWGILLLLTGGVMFFLSCTARERSSPVLSPAARMKSFVQGWQSTGRKIRMDHSAARITAKCHDRDSLCLLVIGESHSRRRSSLYGAARETTPGLKKLYVEKKIFRFDNAVTPHVMTHLALPGMLTTAGEDWANFHKYPSIPDIFRKASFKTWYIYNQMPDDEGDLPFLAAARRAEHFISFSHSRKRYDFEILEELKKIFAHPAPRKLIILHLRGNHWKYAETFPDSMKHFSSTSGKSVKETIINEYDDSLRALDRFLCQLTEMTAKEKKNGFLLYLPDHGESLYEEENFVGHTDLFPTAAAAELPMFLWLSKEYARPQLIPAIEGALKRPFLSSDLPHLLMKLGGIKTPLFRPERSLIDREFRPLPRYVSTRKKDYEKMKHRTTPISERQ